MWILPTYGRPERCQIALDSIRDAAPSRGTVVIDGDPDPRYDQLNLPPGWMKVRLDENHGVCGVLNRMLTAASAEPWYGFITDDSVVRTFDWSAPLIEAAKRNRGFASSNDGWQSQSRMHGAVAFDGAFLRKLGWWAPPGLTHCYVDDAWEWLGRELGNWSREMSILVEHQHWLRAANVTKDATYEKGGSTFQKDATAYATLKRAGVLRQAADRVEGYVAEGVDTQARLRNRIKSRSLFIATPIGRNPAWQYTLSMVETCVALEKAGIKHVLKAVIGNSNLPRARNELAASFMASQFSDLLFIDDDMGWKYNDVFRLLSSRQPLIAGVGRKKVAAPNTQIDAWACAFLSELITQDDAGCIEMAGVGTAFMRINRDVFEHLAHLHPEWKRPGRHDMPEDERKKYHNFFRFDYDGRAEIGEDMQFCRDWRQCGGKVWIDPLIKLDHVGSYAFNGDFEEILCQH